MVEEKLEDRIIITPLINAREQFGPSSIDLRLGAGFKVVKNTRYTHMDPLNEAEKIKRDIALYTEEVSIKTLKSFILHPGEFALGSTLEFIRLPNDIAARLEGRSTWGRVGLQIHSTAGFVDPGFSGSLTFELQNMGKVPLSLYAGMRVAQISFYQSEESLIPYYKKQFNKYSGKMGTVSSMYSDDQEFKIFRKLRELDNKKYLFSWEHVPGNDEQRLILFLKQRYDIDWLKTAKIKKIDDETIIVSFKENYLSLKFNDDKTVVKIEIDDGRTDELSAKLENCVLNIYRKK